MKRNILVLIVCFFVFPALVFADEYVLVMSKNDNVCQHMLKLYNKDLKKYGKVRYKSHEEFNWIKWENKGIRLRPDKSQKTSILGISSRVALFDINNDHQDEVILYSPSMLSNEEIDVYEIFPYEVLKMLDEEEIIEGEILFPKRMKYFDSCNSIPSVNVYDISEEKIKIMPLRMQKQIDATKSRGDKDVYFVSCKCKINFLKLKNNYYVNFEGPRDSGPGEDLSKLEHYSIISEYQQDNTLNHQCLYLIKESKIGRKAKGIDDRPSLPMPRYPVDDKSTKRRIN